MSNPEFEVAMLGAGAFILAGSLVYMTLLRVDPRLRTHPWSRLLQRLTLIAAVCGVLAIAVGVVSFFLLR